MTGQQWFYPFSMTCRKMHFDILDFYEMMWDISKKYGFSTSKY